MAKPITLPVATPKLVLIAWEDCKVISGDSAWLSNEDHEYNPYIVWQVGFLLKETPQGVHITEAWTPELIGHITQIPRGMIRHMKTL